MTIVRHLTVIQARIETIAENHSVPGKAGVGLDDTLSALAPKGRRRVLMLLEVIKAFSEDSDEKAARAYPHARCAGLVWLLRQLQRIGTRLPRPR